MSRLFLISTPIGNLGDMTQRGLDVLAEVDRVLAEDTRRTGVLLRHFSIDARPVSLHAHNETERAGQVVRWLDAGEDVALVSDAGTPLLSDPGARLVSAVVEAGHDVVPVPGASAILAALVVAGVAPEPFTFFGFIERSGGGRTRRLEEIGELAHTAILFESPRRLARLIDDLVDACGSERRAAVARELTKLHETVVRGTLSELAAYYEGRDVLGEVVVVVEGRGAPQESGEEAARALAGALLERGERPSAVARELARRLSIPRNTAYELVQRMSEETE